MQLSEVVGLGIAAKRENKVALINFSDAIASQEFRCVVGVCVSPEDAAADARTAFVMSRAIVEASLFVVRARELGD